MSHEYLTSDEDASPALVVSDEAILISSQERPGLFGLLVDRYQASFRRVAQRVVRDREEAEDVVQEAFIKIYRYANTFDRNKDRKFSSWAYKIVLNSAITRYHKLKRREFLLPDPAISGIDPTADEARVRFKEALLDRETEELVSSVLEMMPEDLRGLLRAYYLEDKTYKDIAATVGLSNGALKMKLFRARKLFKKLLTS